MPVIVIDPNNPDPQALLEAADIIMQGGIAIYPTETVYGIGVRYDDEQALARLFDLKGRASHKPVLLLLPRSEDLQRISSRVPPEARLLAERFWPGPLTLVVPARPDLPALVTGGGNSIGCRVSSSAAASALVRACGRPITSTSANLSGGPNPSSVADITPDVIARADIVLDAGPTPGTLPSTVYDVSQHPFRLVRAGVIAEADINRALKKT
ncbi:MAG: threonylcarbamoyl-AMP synthase [Deltaproteobacteria bacterium]|nr:threonylcarbamoyl-AMP synthase [Deltaproteobacteria bacterium]